MTPNEFINYVAPKVQNENKKRGYPLFSSVVIAQAILETGWGRASIMLKANAIFGIKATDSWRGKVYSAYTKEVYNFNSITIKDTFRAYNSIEDSIADYFNLICTSSRYRRALETDSPYDCISEIKAGGYATDPDYVTKVVKLINQYRLTDFDGERQIESDVYIKGKTYTLNVDLNVRTGAGVQYGVKKYSDLTNDGKKHAYNQNNAVLKKGTKVTCLQSIKVGSDIWIKIPSGYIAAYYGGEWYVR